jgi:hypothetical protein
MAEITIYREYQGSHKERLNELQDSDKVDMAGDTHDHEVEIRVKRGVKTVSGFLICVFLHVPSRTLRLRL